MFRRPAFAQFTSLPCYYLLSEEELSTEYYHPLEREGRI
jgi:hypothetical protein